MTKLLNDYEYANPVNTFTGLPVNEIKALNEQASKDYEEAHSVKNALDTLYENMDVEDRNLGIKKKTISDYKTKIDDLVKKGDYQNAKYLVRNLKKEYDTNQELQGALKSRKAEKDYYENLRTQLEKGERGEKGGIDRKRYDYAIKKTRLGNVSPLEYDPKTMQFKNSFSGTNIGADLSSEIEKDTDAYIKEFKASGLPFEDNNGKKYKMGQDGKIYTVENIGGAERVFIDKEGVTEDRLRSAIRQHILNQNKYQDYLSEEKDIDKFNLTYNPETKTNEPLNKNHLKEYREDQLKDIYSGADEETIKKLEQSKDLKERAMGNEMRERNKNFDINNPQQLDEIYNQEHKRIKLNQLVYPASIKGAYEKYDYKLFKRNDILKALDYKYAKKLKEDEKIYNPALNNFGEVEVTGNDVKKIQETNTQLKTKVNQALNDLNRSIGTPMETENRAIYQDALDKLNISNTTLKDTYNHISSGAREKLKDRISGFFIQKEGGGLVSNWDYRPTQIQIQELINEARKNKDFETVGLLRVAQEAFNNNKEISESTANKIAEKISNNTDLLNIASNIDKERVQRSTIAYNNDWVTKASEDKNPYVKMIGTIGGAVLHHTGLRNSVDDLIRNDYEDGNNEKNVRNIITIPKGEFKTNLAEANQYNMTSQAILDNAQSINSTTGENLSEIMNGEFYGLNEKGQQVRKQIDPSQTSIGLVTGNADGIPRVVMKFRDDKGHELSFGKGQTRKGFYFQPENPDITNKLFNIAINLTEKGGDKNTALRLKGEMIYGSQLGDLRLGVTSDPIVLKDEFDRPISLRLKRVGEGASIVEDGKTGQPLFIDERTKQPKVFKSKDDLQMNLANAH